MVDIKMLIWIYKSFNQKKRAQDVVTSCYSSPNLYAHSFSCLRRLTVRA